jgi:hypothetical protein
MTVRFLRELSQQSLLVRSAILGAAILLAMAISLPVGYAMLRDKNSFLAGGLAGGVCLLAGWTALGMSELLRRPQQVLALVFVGTIVRMGIPLAAIVAVYLHGGPLVSAGVLYYLITFYLVMLTVEIALILPAGRSMEKPVSARGDLAD